MKDLDILTELSDIIKTRGQQSADTSYTAKLLSQGVDRIAKKIGEEAGEVIIAAKNQDPKELSNEAADLLYHLMILLENQGMSLQDVCQVLRARRAQA
eukprot:COSAG01_NODE_6_length_54687_cov_500.907599_6_plen_98_part_00